MSTTGENRLKRSPYRWRLQWATALVSPDIYISFWAHPQLFSWWGMWLIFEQQDTRTVLHIYSSATFISGHTDAQIEENFVPQSSFSLHPSHHIRSADQSTAFKVSFAISGRCVFVNFLLCSLNLYLFAGRAQLLFKVSVCSTCGMFWQPWPVSIKMKSSTLVILRKKTFRQFWRVWCSHSMTRWVQHPATSGLASYKDSQLGSSDYRFLQALNKKIMNIPANLRLNLETTFLSDPAPSFEAKRTEGRTPWMVL